MKTDLDRVQTAPISQPSWRWVVVLALILLMLTDGTVAGAVALRRDFIDINTAAKVFRATLAFLPFAGLLLAVLLRRWKIRRPWGLFGAIAFVISVGLDCRQGCILRATLCSAISPWVDLKCRRLGLWQRSESWGRCFLRRCFRVRARRRD